MKQKILDALKTKYKSFGLSNEALDRIASALEKTVTKEEEIADAIAKAETMTQIATELQKMRDTEIQKRTDLQREHDDYKAKHPEKKDDDDGKGKGKGDEQKPDIAKIVADAVAAAVKPVQEALDAYKAQNTAKEAVATAKTAFYANKWTTKYKDEADDAWEIATKLNDAKGGKMTHDELVTEVTSLFNKAVQRKGVDATKPFEAEGKQTENFDFSSQAKYLESERLIPKAEGNTN